MASAFDFESVYESELDLLVDLEFLSDPLLPPPSTFLPPGFFRERQREPAGPCYLLEDYFVVTPMALPPSAYFERGA